MTLVATMVSKQTNLEIWEETNGKNENKGRVVEKLLRVVLNQKFELYQNNIPELIRLLGIRLMRLPGVELLCINSQVFFPKTISLSWSRLHMLCAKPLTFLYSLSLLLHSLSQLLPPLASLWFHFWVQGFFPLGSLSLLPLHPNLPYVALRTFWRYRSFVGLAIWWFSIRRPVSSFVSL